MNFISGLLISILVIVLFYGYVAVCLKLSGVGEMLKEVSRTEWCLLLLFFVVSTVFAAYEIGRDRYIYYWDSTIHWRPAAEMTKILFSDPLGTLKRVWHTIGVSDYNWVMPMLYVLPAKVFGNSFGTMLVTVHIFYMCPAFFVLSVCANKFLKMAGYEKTRIFIYAVLPFCMPLVEYVFLQGFFDPPVLMLSALLLVLAGEFSYSRMDWRRSTLMAVGILMIVIFRRHWAYWVVGYIFFLAVGMLFQLNTETWKVTLKYFICNMLYIGAFCVLALLFPFRAFLEHSIRNYSAIYTVWNSGLWRNKLQGIYNAGGIFLILFIVGLFFCVWKNRKAATYFLGSAVLLVVSIVLMERSVDMHDAHFYFFIAPFMSCLAISMEYCWNVLRGKSRKWVIGIVFGGFLVYNFLVCFWSGIFLPHSNQISQALVCRLRYVPRCRDDVEEVRRLVDYLNETSEKYGASVYICASSRNINNQILENAYAPESFSSVKNLLGQSEVDLRDGFNVNFLDAGIVCTEHFADNTSGYTINGKEHTIFFLRDELENTDSPIGRHYEFLKEFSLNNYYPSTVKVWRKVSEFETGDYQYLIDYYDGVFPEYPELFSDRIKAYVP